MKTEKEIQDFLNEAIKKRKKMKRNWGMRITKFETPALDSAIRTLRWVLRTEERRRGRKSTQS